MVRAVVKEPGQAPKVVDVSPDLAVLKGIVGGYIEGVYGWPAGVHAYVNEEGKLKNLPANIPHPNGVETIVGAVIFLGATDSGDEASLTDEQLTALDAMFGGTIEGVE